MLVILVIIMNLLTGSARRTLTSAQQRMCESPDTIPHIIRLFNEMDFVINRSGGTILPHLDTVKFALLADLQPPNVLLTVHSFCLFGSSPGEVKGGNDLH